MTLTEFLLARIAEDEGRLVHDFDCDRFQVYDYGTRQGDCDCLATRRLLAECEAKRRIVEHHEPYAGGSGRPTLLMLASVYSDHPDYDQGWKP